MQISELARQTSVSVHALRHYERLGLIQPLRRPNGYRDYPERMRREVVFIAMSRQLGFSLPQIAARLGEYRAGRLRIADMVQALRERADELDAQISALQALRAQVLSHQAWLEQQAAAPAAPARGAPAPAWPRVRPRGPAASVAAPSAVPTPSRRT